MLRLSILAVPRLVRVRGLLEVRDGGLRLHGDPVRQDDLPGHLLPGGHGPRRQRRQWRRAGHARAGARPGGGPVHLPHGKELLQHAATNVFAGIC